MKSKLYTLTWLLTCGLLISSCDNALDSNLPEEYASVVHFKGVEDEPETEMKLLLTGEDVIYEFEVGKGGNEPAAEANVDIKVMTEEELNTYNKEWNTDYILLPSEYYSFSETSLKFTSEENLKKVQITFKGATLQELADDGKQYVIPMTLSGINTLVHQGLHQSILKLNITVPTVSIEMQDMQKIEKSINDTESDKKVDLPVMAIVDLNENKWTFNATFVKERTALQQLVDEYKSSHTEASEYELMPEENYILPDFLTFENSLLSDAMITVDANGINEEKNYLLPVKLDKCEGRPFNVDDKVFYIHLYVKDQLPSIDLTADMMRNSTRNEPGLASWGEPVRLLEHMFDDDATTYWQSEWTVYTTPGDERKPHDPKYGLYLDIELNTPITYFAFDYQVNKISDLHAAEEIELYFCNSINDLTQDIQPEVTISASETPDNMGDWFYSKNYSKSDKSSFKYVRISCIKNHEGKDLRQKLNSSVSFAELRIYGLEQK